MDELFYPFLIPILYANDSLSCRVFYPRSLFIASDVMELISLV